MKQCLVVIGICFFAATCFGGEQSRYYNSDWHFSFVLPEGWEYIHAEDLPSDYRKTIEKSFSFKSANVAVCQKVGAEYFKTPYILVQIKSSEEMSEVVVENLFLKNKKFTLKNLEMMIELLQKAESGMLESWKGAERIGAEVEYDKERHISFETATLYHKRVGDIIAITVKILGSHRMATLRCYADGEDAENFLNLVSRVVDSFKYDMGYVFGEAKGIAPGFAQKLLRNTWQSLLLWVVGFIIVSWLIHRWVTG
ncbi:MAG: hypothetical protein ACYS0I_06465 [Planctomycetota bacterium]|jgi:hypothetical protein